MAVDYSAVSVLVGDIANALIGTAQIYTLSTLHGENSYTLGAASARYIAATFANSVTKKAGDVSINASDKFAHYMALAAKLDKQAATASLGATSAYAGGISQSDKDTVEDNTDRVAPAFTKTLHDDPGLSSDELTNEW